MKAIPTQALAQHIAVLGKTGSGKTSTAKLCIEQVVADGARVCVLDPIKSDWWGLTSSADGKKPGLPFQILGGPHGHVPLHAGAGAAIGELVATGALPLSIIDMADFGPGGQAKFFIAFAEKLMKRMRGVLYLVIEEAHEFAPKERSGVGEENMAVYYAKKLATAGRSKGIRLIACTHRVQSLHNAILGSCDTVIVHRMTAPADQAPILQWLKGSISDKAQREHVAETIPRLKTGQGWLCSGEAAVLELINFPRIHTFDNSATPEQYDVHHGHQVVTAKVDQEALRALIGKSVEEAEAKDPAKLQARIAELERDLSRVKQARPGTSDDDLRKAVEGADTRGYERGWKDARCAHGKAYTAALDAAERSVVSAIDSQMRVTIQSAFNLLRNDTGDRVEVRVRELVADADPEVSIRAVRSSAQDFALPTGPQIGDIQVMIPPAYGKRTARERLLDRLFWLESMGINPAPRETLAAVSGVSPTSGSYDQNLAALRRDNFIEYQPGSTVRLTNLGQEAALDPEATDGKRVHEHWLEIVKGPQRRILEALIAAHPGTLDKTRLAERVEVSPTSGSYDQNLAYLRRIRAIDYAGGQVHLTRYVMP